VPKRAGRVADGLDDMVISLYAHERPRHHAPPLTFLGIGVQPPASTWGGLLAFDITQFNPAVPDHDAAVWAPAPQDEALNEQSPGAEAVAPVRKKIRDHPERRRLSL
jgi:hypothetical protein